jgi:hypothetical protein
MYDFTQAVPVDQSLTTLRFYQRFPNANLEYQPTKSPKYGRPVKVTICPQCQGLCSEQIRGFLAAHPNAP